MLSVILWILGIIIYIITGIVVVCIFLKISGEGWDSDPDSPIMGIVFFWPLAALMGIIVGAGMLLDKIGRYISREWFGLVPSSTTELPETEQDIPMPETLPTEEGVSTVVPQDRFKIMDME